MNKVEQLKAERRDWQHSWFACFVFSVGASVANQFTSGVVQGFFFAAAALSAISCIVISCVEWRLDNKIKGLGS